MGMDSYFYRTSKVEAMNHDNKMARIAELEKKLNEYIDSLENKYEELKTSVSREVLDRVATKDEIKKLDDMFNEKHSIEDEDGGEGEELYYWRKPWGLHWYIVEHCGDHNNDNCERIYVTKDFVKQLVEELARHKKMSIEEFEMGTQNHKNPFAKGDYWDIDDLNRTYNFFKEVLESWSDDFAYYYYSWY